MFCLMGRGGGDVPAFGLNLPFFFAVGLICVRISKNNLKLDTNYLL